MNDVWIWANQNSDVIWGAAMFIVGIISPSAARRIKRMVKGSK